MVRKVSRKSHRRFGETEAAELKAARRLVKKEDARKARGRQGEKGATCRAMPPPKRSWAPARASRGFSEGRGRGSTEVQNVSWLNLDRSWHGKIKQNLGTTLLTRSFVGSVPSLNTILLLSSFLILVLRKQL